MSVSQQIERSVSWTNIGSVSQRASESGGLLVRKSDCLLVRVKNSEVPLAGKLKGLLVILSICQKGQYS